MITIQDTIYMGTAAPASGGGGSGDAVWGSITGTLSNQTDLSNALAGKQNVIDANNKLSVSYVSGLATVATTGAYSDLSGTPTVDQSYDGISTNAQSGVAVKSAIDAAISSVYKAAGSVAFASLPTPSASNEGYVYNVTDAFTTDSQFVEGSGKSYPAGTNVVVIDTGSSVYKFDVLTGMVDLSGYVPTSRTVNGKALTSDITLTASDVSALPSSTVIPTVNNATLTITQGGVSKGTFTANASSDVTIALDGSSSISYDNSTINENSSNELQAIGVKEARADTAIRLWHGTEQQWNQGGGIKDAYYNWENPQGNAITLSESYTGKSIVYGGGKWIMVNRFANSAFCSTDDGATWSTLSLPESFVAIAYGNNTFVGLNRGSFMGSGTAYYSTDGGTTWTDANIQGQWWNIAFGNGTFVGTALFPNPLIAYSSDNGVTWTTTDIPDFHAQARGIAFGNGTFVITGSDNIPANAAAYSTDNGVSWTSTYMPSSAYWDSVAFGNGKFVAVDCNAQTSNVIAISTNNGASWTEYTLPISAKWGGITFAEGKFVIVPNEDNQPALYSTDGINWSQTPFNIPASMSVAYGNGKFITSPSGSTDMEEITFSSVYTDTESPTTASTVYSAPGTASALTITAVGTGTITLSDTNTYNYNASGNEYSYYNVGEAHPNYLCFIDGVGVKMGTTTIANNLAVTVDQTYNASSTNAQSGVAVASGINDTLGTIETALQGV